MGNKYSALGLHIVVKTSVTQRQVDALEKELHGKLSLFISSLVISDAANLKILEEISHGS